MELQLHSIRAWCLIGKMDKFIFHAAAQAKRVSNGMQLCIYTNYRVSERRLIGQRLTRVIKTQQSTIEASITLDGVTLTDSLIR
jgi:hypothetical protein